MHAQDLRHESIVRHIVYLLTEPGNGFVGEVQWLHPAISIDLLWDNSLSSSNEASQTSILQGLLQQALTGPLLPAQQQQVLEQLQANPKRVFSCGLTPQRLPDLVELNPAVAIEVIDPSCLFDVALHGHQPALFQLSTAQRHSCHSVPPHSTVGQLFETL